MLIEIRCGNFSNFDPALNKYVECQETLIVSSDQLGEIVTCTKCKQPVEVPYDAPEQVSAPAAAPVPAKKN